MRVVVVGLLLLSGCDALFGLTHVKSRVDGDSDDDGAVIDGNIDADTVNFCMGTGRGFHPKFCYPLTAPFSGMLQLAGTIDTDTSCDEVQPQQSGSGVCIRKAVTIRVESNVRVIGGRPLVLLASDRIDVTGMLDASSFRSGTKGAGSNTSETAPCIIATIHGGIGTLSNGGGGGAGGSFRGAAGNGGNGDMSSGGIANPAENPHVIRGGCNGGNGGSGNAGGNQGTLGAAGGGSLYLAATNAIVVTGTITANGAGGEGGSTYYGGAGGGAGGMIVLDAPSVTVAATASLLAVGGGGGQGGSKTGGGGDGMDGPISTGGTSSDSGGTGGNGSPGNAGNGGSGSGGGGGGGGGGGYIAIPSPHAVVDTPGSHRPQAIIQ